MKPTFLALASAVACAVFAGAVPLANLAWNLPPTARIEGETLAVEVPPGDGNVRAEAYAHCTAELDLSEILDAGLGAAVSVRVRAVGVSEPDAPWNGVKFMLRYVEEDTGETRWPGVKLPRGTFDWTNATVRLNRLAAPVPPAGGRVTLVLGLQGCTGRAEFDLTSLVLSAEPSGLEPVNQNYIVRYPDDDSDNRRPTTDNPPLRGNLLQGPSGLAGSPQPGGRRGAPLCGCMLPGRATTEDDIETLHRWGATLARFQIMRNWFMDNDCQDLDEYARWIDSRLDNLEDVLRWAAARGMKICVDLHSPPGGKRPGDRAMNMFFEEKYADAFVETWKRIAARCAPILQTTGPVIYGYDLVNEPVQKEAAPFGYWELQRRAAEAVRAIDPVTPVIVESNLSAAPSAFRYLSPLAMDNVIYQIHLYKPHDYTHQGIQGVPVGAVWPDPGRGATATSCAGRWSLCATSSAGTAPASTSANSVRHPAPPARKTTCATASPYSKNTDGTGPTTPSANRRSGTSKRNLTPPENTSLRPTLHASALFSTVSPRARLTTRPVVRTGTWTSSPRPARSRSSALGRKSSTGRRNTASTRRRISRSGP